MSSGEEVQWLGPIVVLAIGLIAGAILLFRTKRGSPAGESVPPSRPDVQEEFDAMIGRLRELASSGSAFDKERLALEREAAVLLRELASTPRVEVPVVVSGNRALRAMLWTTGSCVALSILYVVLMQSTAPRPKNVPLTGGMPTGDTTLASLEQQLAAQPENVELRIEMARVHLDRGDMQGVLRETEAALKQAPEHPRALSYNALARLSMGDSDGALALLERAISRQPDLVEAWIHLSLVHTQRGDRMKATQALQTAKRHAPESAALIDTLQREIDARFGITPAAETAAAAGISYPIRISGTSAPGSIIFVTLRAEGVTSGPPVAAKRLDGSSLPLDVVISSADSMQGGALPARARIDVRVDADGDPLTREAGAPAAMADGVSPGVTTDLRLK